MPLISVSVIIYGCVYPFTALSKILAEVGITKGDAAAKKCSDKFITQLVHKVRSYEDLAAHLGLNEVATEDISIEARGEPEKKRRALKLWRNERGSEANHLSLAMIFLKMNDRTVAEYVINSAKTPDSSEDEAATTEPNYPPASQGIQCNLLNSNFELSKNSNYYCTRHGKGL